MLSSLGERLEFSGYSEKSKSPREIEEEIEKKREQYQCSLQPFYRQCKRNEVGGGFLKLLIKNLCRNVHKSFLSTGKVGS